MGKTLIITEKPSVAAELSKVLSRAEGMSRFKKDKSGECYENESHVISSAIGHLVELEKPTTGGRKMQWDMKNLPIIPERFGLKPIDRTKKRFNLLKRLMKRKDVSGLINACDAGREGELIFRYLVEATAVDKPISRLWMQSMTARALIEAFERQRTDEAMLPLAAAARCRSESDWLVGINATRALTAFNSRHGGFHLTPVGRVQTPTLAILVKREREISGFTARTYYEIHGDFEVEAGVYPGRWFREGFKKGDDADDRAERLWDEEEALRIAERCRGQKGAVEEAQKPKKQSPPLLYDLTSLQREASNRFGFSARRTLQIVQALYERHKAVTYPRTDSRFLPEDYPPFVRDTLASLAKGGASVDGDAASFAGKAVADGMVKGGNKRIFNNTKVSDHFAIIPTGTVPGKSLSVAERKIYDAIVRRFIAVFYGAAEFLVTTRITRIESDAFKTEGKVLVDPGWLAVYGKSAQTAGNGNGGEDDGQLVPWRDGEEALNLRAEVETSETKPPPRYSEATLLSAMEGAGKLVEDEELRAAMSERGLGTPATRAAIIEGLIHDKYVERTGKTLVATNKGIGLVAELETIGLDVLCAPELTGDWEFKLKEIEHGALGRNSFMEDIRAMTGDIVRRIKGDMEEVREQPYPDLDVPCPLCGAAPLTQDDSYFSCPSPTCRFRVGKKIASRELSEEEVRTLAAARITAPLHGFRSRTGETFSAALAVDDTGKVTFAFDREDEVRPELNDPLAECPVCRAAGREGTIHEVGDAYVCDRFYEEPKCGARLSKHILKKEISRENAEKFFAEGKTAVIDNFISRRNGRPFSASLKLITGGEKLFEWEFPPRVRKGGSRRGGGKKKPSAG